MGDGFSVEVENLENAADKALRPLAVELSEAKALLMETTYSDRGFTAGENDADGIFAPAGAAWDETRGFLDRIFADNADNLVLAARALTEIARRYREADDAVTGNLRSIEGQGLG